MKNELPISERIISYVSEDKQYQVTFEIYEKNNHSFIPEDARAFNLIIVRRDYDPIDKLVEDDEEKNNTLKILKLEDIVITKDDDFNTFYKRINKELTKEREEGYTNSQPLNYDLAKRLLPYGYEMIKKEINN